MRGLGGIAAIVLWAFAAPAAAQKLPNLRVVEVQHARSNASPGDQLAITDKVKNVGGKTAGPSVVRFYLSDDQDRDRADTRLVGSQNVGSVSPGVKFVGHHSEQELRDAGADLVVHSLAELNSQT